MRISFVRRTVAAIALFLFATGALPAALPQQIGAWKKTASQPATLPDAAIAREYGFEEGEEVRYTNGSQELSFTVWRFADTTGSFAAWQLLRPADAKPLAAGADRAVRSGQDTWVHRPNHVLRFTGSLPAAADAAALYAVLPQRGPAALPAVTSVLPVQGRIANSERFVLGPDSLRSVEPAIPASIVGFEVAAEAQSARYQTSAGALTLVLFNYPTPQAAQQRLAGFQALPGVVVNRSGPYIAVVSNSAHPAAARALVGQVKWGAEFIWNERIPIPDPPAGPFFWGLILLCGWLMVFALSAGLIFAGVRTLYYKLSGTTADNQITLIDLK